MKFYNFMTKMRYYEDKVCYHVYKLMSSNSFTLVDDAYKFINEQFFQSYDGKRVRFDYVSVMNIMEGLRIINHVINKSNRSDIDPELDQIKLLHEIHSNMVLKNIIVHKNY